MRYMNGMQDHGDIVNLWPDAVVMAKEIGVDSALTRQWRHRGRIPVEYWERVVIAGKARRFRISYQTMMRLNPSHGSSSRRNGT